MRYARNKDMEAIREMGKFFTTDDWDLRPHASTAWTVVKAIALYVVVCIAWLFFVLAIGLAFGTAASTLCSAAVFFHDPAFPAGMSVGACWVW